MQQYFIAAGDQKAGPFTLAELAARRITAKTPVWYAGLPQWVYAEQVPELRAQLGPDAGASRPESGAAAGLHVGLTGDSARAGGEGREQHCTPPAVGKVSPRRPVTIALAVLLAGIVGWSLRGRRQLAADAPHPVPVSDSTSTGSAPKALQVPWPAATDGVDERLYLVYRLKAAYQFMPQDASDPAVLAKALGESRHSANRVLEYVRARKLDPQLEVLYADLIRAIDVVTDAWVQAGRVNRDAVARAESVGNSADAQAMTTTITTALTAEATGGLSLIGGGADLLSGGRERNEKLAAIDEVTRRSIEDTRRAAGVQISSILARAEAVSRDLCLKYGWAEDETGLSTLLDEIKAFEAFGRSKDFRGFLECSAKIRAKRPHDPVASLIDVVCRFQQAVLQSDTQRMKELSEDCYDLTKLVPSGAIYDEDRGGILIQAATMMKNASYTLTAKKGKAWVSANDPWAKEAEKWFELADRYVQWPAADETGECRETRAVVLALSGRRKEALEQLVAIDSIRRNDFDHAYLMAAMLAESDQPDASLQWLTYLLSVLPPGESPHFFAIDPSLVKLRAAREEAVKDLLAVKFDWNITWGIRNDDIWITNKSAFALSNVLFNPRISTGREVYAPQLKVGRLERGQTHTWPNAVSVTGSRYDSANATVTCDQNT